MRHCPSAPPDYSPGFSPCPLSQETNMKHLWNKVSFTLAFSGAQPMGGPGSKAEAMRKDIQEYLFPWLPPAGSWVGSLWVPLPWATAPVGWLSRQTQAPLYSKPTSSCHFTLVVGRLRNACFTLRCWFPLTLPTLCVFIKTHFKHLSVPSVSCQNSDWYNFPKPNMKKTVGKNIKFGHWISCFFPPYTAYSKYMWIGSTWSLKKKKKERDFQSRNFKLFILHHV